MIAGDERLDTTRDVSNRRLGTGDSQEEQRRSEARDLGIAKTKREVMHFLSADVWTKS
jgi:hypothetical protein